MVEMHSERAGSLTWWFHQNLMYSFIVTGKLCLFADNWDVYQKPGWTGKQAGTCRSVSYRTSAGLAPAGRVTPARSPVEHDTVPLTFFFLFLSSLWCLLTIPLAFSLSWCVLVFMCAVLRQTPYVLWLRTPPASISSSSLTRFSLYLHPCLVSHSWGQTKAL